MHEDYRYSTYDDYWYGTNHFSPYSYSYDAPYYVGASSTSNSFVSSSTLAKVAIVAGGALAILFIFRASKAAEKLESVHERAGRMAGKMLRARYSGSGGSKAVGAFGEEGRNRLGVGNRGGSSTDALLGSTDSYKLLSA